MSNLPQNPSHREIYIPRKFENDIKHRLPDLLEDLKNLSVDAIERILVWKMTLGWPIFSKQSKEDHELDILEIKKEFRLQLENLKNV